jgi:hypothetical protein
MPQSLLFLNYTHPTQLQTSNNRRTINTFASKQNARKKRLEGVAQFKRLRQNILGEDEQDIEETVIEEPARGNSLLAGGRYNALVRNKPKRPSFHLSPSIGGFRADPINPYPVEYNDSTIPRLVDYCSSRLSTFNILFSH